MNQKHITEIERTIKQYKQLSAAERQTLMQSLARYARHNLYDAARLARNHIPKEMISRLPPAIRAADQIAKVFEDHTRQTQRAVPCRDERDRMIRQPSDGREYQGPIVGTTPNCVVQLDRQTGDLVVHSRLALNRTLEASGNDENLAIKYPFRAIGGVGLVRGMEPERQAGDGLQHSLAPAREQTRTMERDL